MDEPSIYSGSLLLVMNQHTSLHLIEYEVSVCV